jgi:hypothetical protein
MHALKAFLIGTLTILVPAIIGLIFVEQLKAWQGTPWLIGVASLCLGDGPVHIVLEAARSSLSKVPQ